MIILKPNNRNNVLNSLPFIAQIPPLLFGHTDRPSSAWLRTADQFVLIKVRTGIVDVLEVELALAILEDMNRLQIQPGNREYLMLRGLYFDYMGSATFYIDLLHDASIQPSYKTDKLAQYLHNGTSWYNGQTTIIDVSVQEVDVDADDFYAIDDGFYQRFREH